MEFHHILLQPDQQCSDKSGYKDDIALGPCYTLELSPSLCHTLHPASPGQLELQSFLKDCLNEGKDLNTCLVQMAEKLR